MQKTRKCPKYSTTKVSDVISITAHGISETNNFDANHLIGLLQKQFKQDSKTLVACADNSNVYVYDLRIEEPIYTIPAEGVTSIAFINDQQILVADAQKQVRLWDSTLKKFTKRTLNECAALDLAVVDTSCIMHNGCSKFKSWETTTGDTKYNRTGYIHGLQLVDKQRFVTIHEASVIVWDYKTLEPINEIKCAKPQSEARTSAYNIEDVIAVPRNKHILLLDVRNGRVIDWLELPDDHLRFSSFVRMVNDTYALVVNATVENGQKKHVCSLWNVKSKQVEKECFQYNANTYRPFSIKGDLMYYIDNGIVQVYNLATKKTVRTISNRVVNAKVDVAVW